MFKNITVCIVYFFILEYYEGYKEFKPNCRDRESFSYIGHHAVENSRYTEHQDISRISGNISTVYRTVQIYPKWRACCRKL